MHLRLTLSTTLLALLLLPRAAGATPPVPAGVVPGTIPAPAGPCRAAGKSWLISPLHAAAGQPVWLAVASEQPLDGRLVAWDAAAKPLPLTRGKGWDGPPDVRVAQLTAPAAGRYKAALVTRDGSVQSCTELRVHARRRRAAPPRPKAGVWPVQRHWSRAMENLYAVWIAHLFDAPPTERPSWTPLHQLFRDPARNVLYNHLGLGEDDAASRNAVIAKPDCADMPYFLRAYFAWKMRLPFAYARCSRGRRKHPPRCGEWRFQMEATPPEGLSEAKAMSWYLRKEVSSVHSGNGRTMPDDDKTDLYPVGLSRSGLRPGIVFADPYGHLLVISKWVRGAPGQTGALFAVDGHPDLSVGRKRFWRGAFLFHTNLSAGAGGFKAFRPIVRDQKAPSGWKVLSNREIARHPGYRNYSREQYQHGTDGWYERVDRAINPEPLPAPRVLEDRLLALHELVQERVDSVRLGEEWVKKNPGKTIPMPKGPGGTPA